MIIDYYWWIFYDYWELFMTISLFYVSVVCVNGGASELFFAKKIKN